MARRRRQSGTGSLELLLDTICNVFGGMILMAILVVIMTQSAVGHLPEPEPEDVERVIDARKLRSQRDRLERRLSELGRERRELKKQIEAFGDTGMSELNARRKQFERALEQAKGRLNELEDELRRAADERGKVKAALSQVENQLKVRRASVVQLKEKAKSVRRAPQEKTRLPHRRGAALEKSVAYIISGARAYPMTDEHCHAERTGPSSARLKPRADKGYRIGLGDQAGPALAHITRAADARESYVHFFVYPTDKSHKGFFRLKNRVLKKRFRYRVAPCILKEGWVQIRFVDRAPSTE